MFGVDAALYLKLSAMMFLEYAIWGAWYPVLAARLLGPLNFSGKQTGWIYATIPLGCIFMPLVAGQVADQWINTEFILAGAHLVGVLLLFIAAWKRNFGSLFGVMLVYALCYAATLPLVNSLMFHHLAANDIDIAKSQYIFMWAPIAWALAGYFLTGWRWVFRTGEEGRDCLVLAAVLSVIMAVVAGVLLPTTPPAKAIEEFPLAKALSMLQNSSFLIFIVISMVGAGMMQFYFLGTAQFMQESGIAPKNVPASMAVAQAVQAIATLAVFGWFIRNAGFGWVLPLGIACWLLLYIEYVIADTRIARIIIVLSAAALLAVLAALVFEHLNVDEILRVRITRIAALPAFLILCFLGFRLTQHGVIIASQAFHGLAYVFFIIAGQTFAAAVAPKDAGASMQALIFTAQSGIGLFLGTQFAGIVMDKFRVEGQFQWRRLWMVPGAIMLACVLALILFFKGSV